MSNSLIEAAGKFGFKLKIGCPKKYEPSKKIINWAKKNKVELLVTKKPEEAVKDSNLIFSIPKNYSELLNSRFNKFILMLSKHKKLSQNFSVIAVDSIGFGHSEKPSLPAATARQGVCIP